MVDVGDLRPALGDYVLLYLGLFSDVIYGLTLLFTLGQIDLFCFLRCHDHPVARCPEAVPEPGLDLIQVDFTIAHFKVERVDFFLLDLNDCIQLGQGFRRRS
ncbi:hypothetical protein D3C81_1590320 [compost metagenome]